MRANTRGTVLVKCDRINDRIDEFVKYFLKLEKHKDLDVITKDDFKDFVASVHLIVTTELNDKGVERQWKK